MSAPVMQPTIQPAEVERLVVLESVIERGIKTFVEVGTALAEIRDSRLYRATHRNFTDYCKERWGMDKSRAHQLIGASAVVGNLSTIVDTTPATESQARPLTSLEPDKQREVWKEAVATAPNGKVTAAHVATTTERMTEPPLAEDPEPENSIYRRHQQDHDPTAKVDLRHGTAAERRAVQEIGYVSNALQFVKYDGGLPDDVRDELSKELKSVVESINRFRRRVEGST